MPGAVCCRAVEGKFKIPHFVHFGDKIESILVHTRDGTFKFLAGPPYAVLMRHEGLALSAGNFGQHLPT